jgi:HPr kinase/phosphorylase
MTNRVLIKDFLDTTDESDLDLRLLAGKKGLDKEIPVGDINRPGLTLAGFDKFFAYERIQIFGRGEQSYIQHLADEERQKVYSRFFSYDILCSIFTHNVEPDEEFIRLSEEKNIPVFISELKTSRFISSLVHILDEIFAPSVTLHGTLVDVYGIGMLLLGKSGVGKSECALELIERGHRLVADDMVLIKKIDESLLFGSGTPVLKHHMEIRGMGIINVRDIFGIRSVRNRKRIELVVLLEEWDSGKEYDRLGLEEKKYQILDQEIPYIVVPVRPGRNIPVIIEAASLNHRLKKLGIFSAHEFDRKIQEWMKRENAES